MVQQALDRLRKINKYTTIVIAHRLSTIQDADRIAVIANKGIAEMGTHSELLSTNGMYTALCAMQQVQVANAETESRSRLDAADEAALSTR